MDLRRGRDGEVEGVERRRIGLIGVGEARLWYDLWVDVVEQVRIDGNMDRRETTVNGKWRFFDCH